MNGLFARIVQPFPQAPIPFILFKSINVSLTCQTSRITDDAACLLINEINKDKQMRPPLTMAGAEHLRTELTRLKNIERPLIAEEIAEARAHGDLKENAEYHAARDKQGLLEARIRHIENVLSNAQVIDISKVHANGKIIFGATVELLNVESDETVTYQIVGDEESNLEHNKISVNSPIARALIGKEEGDEVVVKAPSGNLDYEIISVNYV
jgi:transcription elongation factor GreA